jgi:SAM-dependent methyltransferase
VSRPIDLPTRMTMEFVAGLLPKAGSRLIEVGCGSGELAAALGAAGHRVVGIELSTEAAAEARAAGVEVLEGDFLELDPGPCDAVLFARSLHHVSDLERALEHAGALLLPGGAVICEEFDLLHIDEATAHWFYSLRAEHLPDDELPGSDTNGALERWEIEHLHDPPLHDGEAMLEATRRRFRVEAIERVPYLYRYIAARLPADPGGLRTTERTLTDELSGIRAGRLLPVGLRWAATRAQSGSDSPRSKQRI